MRESKTANHFVKYMALGQFGLRFELGSELQKSFQEIAVGVCGSTLGFVGCTAWPLLLQGQNIMFVLDNLASGSLSWRLHCAMQGLESFPTRTAGIQHDGDVIVCHALTNKGASMMRRHCIQIHQTSLS